MCLQDFHTKSKTYHDIPACVWEWPHTLQKLWLKTMSKAQYDLVVCEGDNVPFKKQCQGQKMTYLCVRVTTCPSGFAVRHCVAYPIKDPPLWLGNMRVHLKTGSGEGRRWCVCTKNQWSWVSDHTLFTSSSTTTCGQKLRKVADSASGTQDDHTTAARFFRFFTLNFLESPPSCNTRRGQE